MPTKEQVLAVLDGGTDYVAAAKELGINPGLAYLIATGLPADGSDVPTAEELARPGVLATSTQHLANPALSKPSSSLVVHDFLKQRALSDPQMVEATRSRTATPGEVNDPEGVPEVLTVLRRQHDSIDAMVKQLSAIPGRSKGGTAAQASQRESIVDMITMALATHETAEEEHFWPRVREVLPDGDAWARGGTEQEQRGNEILLELSHLDAQLETYDELVEELMQLLHKHVAYEDRLFLEVEKAMSWDDRVELGERILAAQRHAPTRPHPLAPREPGPAVAVSAKAAVPLDRARDATGRPADREGHPEPGLPD